MLHGKTSYFGNFTEGGRIKKMRSGKLHHPPYSVRFKYSIIAIGTTVVQWLRCCATNRKRPGSIQDGVIGIFH
jgi:hypothetical protein